MTTNQGIIYTTSTNPITLNPSTLLYDSLRTTSWTLSDNQNCYIRPPTFTSENYKVFKKN